MQQLIAASESSSRTGSRKIALWKATATEKVLSSISKAIGILSADPGDACLRCQYEEKLSDLKEELGDIRNSLLPLDLGEGDELSILQAEDVMSL